MTTQDLGRDVQQGAPTEDDHLGELFDRSPALPVHTSAAAEVAFLAGLVAVVSVPFSLMTAVCLGLAAVALVSSVVGLARASRPLVAGTLLASIGLVLALATFALVGLRYLGIDTTVGDAAVPTLTDWLRSLNDLLPPT